MSETEGIIPSTEEERQARSEQMSKDNVIFWLKEIAGMVESDQITAAEVRTLPFQEVIDIAKTLWEEAQQKVDQLQSEE